MQYYRGQHQFANTLAADNMDFADSCGTRFGLVRSIHPRIALFSYQQFFLWNFFDQAQTV